MAATVTDAPLATGLTLTLELYADGSDTIANGAGGDVGVEATTGKTLYSWTISETLSGLYRAVIKNGTAYIGGGYVWMVDGATCAIHFDRQQAILDSMVEVVA